jgi:hypothetical protein
LLQIYVSSVSNVYIAVASYGCCKSRSGMLHILHMLQEFVQNVSSVPDICCKRFGLDVAYVSHICCNSMSQMFYLL